MKINKFIIVFALSILWTLAHAIINPVFRNPDLAFTIKEIAPVVGFQAIEISILLVIFLFLLRFSEVKNGKEKNN